MKHDPGATDGEDYDSEDERERKLLQLQEQLRQMQEQMKILVEESIRWEILKFKINVLSIKVLLFWRRA